MTMQYAFYPGCVSKGGCPELYPAALKVCARLGIDLVEMTDVGCTGAGVLPAEISDPINARTFAQAEAQGLPIMTICSTCTGVMTQANARLQEERYREAINAEHLAEQGLSYRGATKVKHLLWMLLGCGLLIVVLSVFGDRLSQSWLIAIVLGACVIPHLFLMRGHHEKKEAPPQEKKSDTSSHHGGSCCH